MRHVYRTATNESDRNIKYDPSRNDDDKIKRIDVGEKKNYNKKEIEYSKFWEYSCYFLLVVNLN